MTSHHDFTLSYESPYIRRASRSTVRVRLFCFPHAGAGAATFAGWPSQFPPGVEIVAIQPPGREDRIDEPPFTDATPLIRQIVQVVRPYLQAPFALYGHSGGALMAFEVARALQARYRRPPVHLFVSGQPAPDTTEAVQRLGHLEDAAFVEAIHGLGGTSAAVTQDPQLLEILVPTLRADFTMWERYTFEPGAPLDCPITAFGGTTDPRAPLATIDAWRHHTGGVFSLRLFEGNHFFTGDYLAELTSQITAALL